MYKRIQNKISLLYIYKASKIRAKKAGSVATLNDNIKECLFT